MLHIQFWDTFSDRQVFIPTNLYSYNILFQSTVSLGLPSCSLQKLPLCQCYWTLRNLGRAGGRSQFQDNCTSAVMIAAICRAFYRSFKENGAWYFEATTNSEHSVFCEERCIPESNHASGILNAFYGLSSYLLPFQGHHSVHFHWATLHWRKPEAPRLRSHLYPLCNT